MTFPSDGLEKKECKICGFTLEQEIMQIIEHCMYCKECKIKYMEVFKHFHESLLRVTFQQTTNQWTNTTYLKAGGNAI